MKKQYLSILALSSVLVSALCAEQNIASSFNTRSISRNAARDLAGWTNYINKNSPRDVVYGVWSLTPEYTHTFNGHTITRTLFGDNLIGKKCAQHLKISGSDVADRGPQDLLADYFYLPSDFESTVRFEPVIDNVIFDLGFYLGLDAWAKGLYFVVHAPFAHTRWDININENIINPGVANYIPGYFTPTTLQRNQLLDSFTDFVNGKSIQNTEDIAFEELKFAQMSTDRLVRSRMAEIRTAIGWNFFAEDDYHVGFNGQIAWPTGLRPDALFLFEPLVGNGHFWELGFGLNGHYTFWYNEDESSHCSFYIDCNITHLFRTRQARSFDLTKNGTLSRYMLAIEMTSPAVNLQGTNGDIPSAQFNNDYLPVANITTLDVEVSVAIQADIVLMFNATRNNWSFDFGYNYWGRSPDNITLRQNESFDEKRFALKGDAHEFGYLPNSTDFIALSATEDRATIHAGTNASATNPAQNPNIDFPQLATDQPVILQATPLLYAPNFPFSPDSFINTSIPPIFITRNDLNFEGAQTSGSSNKIFGHLSYTWSDKVAWQPYLGFGFESEWSSKTKGNCSPCNDHDAQAAASQWGVWVKTGVTF